MNKAQIKRLTVRWSLLTSGAIALFWLIYAAIYGEVPRVPIWTADPWTPWFLRNVPAPFNISRWFDVLLGVTLVPISILSLFCCVSPDTQSKREEPDPETDSEDHKPSDFDILRFALCLAVATPALLGLFCAAEGGLPAGIIGAIISWFGAIIVLALTALYGICMISLGHALVFAVRRLVTERTYYKRLTASSTTKWFGGK